jgi:Domain of unknown function (DUF4920)
MKKLLFALFCCFAVALCATTQAQEVFFGEKISAKGAKKSNQLSKMLAGKDSLTDIKITGKVHSVCKKKGCWMKMDMGGRELMVRFKDYGFFVPKDCDGKTATIQGKVKKEIIDVAALKHYAEDAGKSKEEIEKITKPEEKYTFEAVGVILK